MERRRPASRALRRLPRQNHQRHSIRFPTPQKTVHRRVRNTPTQICRFGRRSRAHSGIAALEGLPVPPRNPRGSGRFSDRSRTPLEVETPRDLAFASGTMVRTPQAHPWCAICDIRFGVCRRRAALSAASRHLNFLQRELPAERAAIQRFRSRRAKRRGPGIYSGAPDPTPAGSPLRCRWLAAKA